MIAMRERPRQGTTDSWLTPMSIIQALGPFDLDPCCPPTMPWQTAARMINQPECGLSAEWSGFVWLNPPYGPNLTPWLAKMAAHNNGIALAFCRTDTSAFHRFVFPVARGLFFFERRLVFCGLDGAPAKGNAAASHCLIFYGTDAMRRLAAISTLRGYAVPLCGWKSEVKP